MSSEVKVLDIEAHLGKVRNRVALVGVELEGAWITLPDGVVQVEPDGSVFNRRTPVGTKYCGELPVGPVPPTAIGALMMSHYPHKVNHTCGMHVHMSFNTLWHYQLLMIPEYQETMLHYLTLWAKTKKTFKEGHHIWGRLAGESPYCRKEFWPDLQSSTKRKNHNMNVPGHRYTAVHYCGRQGTIEVRVLPMMPKVKLAIQAVQQVVDITNACLYVLGKANKNRVIGTQEVVLPNNMIYSETVVQEL